MEKGGLVEKGRWRLSWASPQTYPCTLHVVLEFGYLGEKRIKSIASTFYLFWNLPFFRAG